MLLFIGSLCRYKSTLAAVNIFVKPNDPVLKGSGRAFLLGPTKAEHEGSLNTTPGLSPHDITQSTFDVVHYNVDAPVCSFSYGCNKFHIKIRMGLTVHLSLMWSVAFSTVKHLLVAIVLSLLNKHNAES